MQTEVGSRSHPSLRVSDGRGRRVSRLSSDTRDRFISPSWRSRCRAQIRAKPSHDWSNRALQWGRMCPNLGRPRRSPNSVGNSDFGRTRWQREFVRRWRNGHVFAQYVVSLGPCLGVADCRGTQWPCQSPFRSPRLRLRLEAFAFDATNTKVGDEGGQAPMARSSHPAYAAVAEIFVAHCPGLDLCVLP